MRILHTADLHLRDGKDERWKALQTLVGVAAKENVDIFVISGDLFDRGIDAENLRTRMRKIFSRTPFKTILLPGNHDASSLERGTYFGDNFEVLTCASNCIEEKEARIVGIPFEPMGRTEVLSKISSLKEALRGDKPNILVYHGELLDAFYSRDEFGDEGGERHMPLKLSYFDELNVNYVLAGHFHTKFSVKPLRNGGYFVYPGSPISITRKEIGRRKANVFDLGKPPHDYLLDTPHYEEVKVTLDPFAKDDPVKVIQDRLREFHPAAKILLTVGGYVNSAEVGMTETQLFKKIREITTGKLAEEPQCELKDVKDILENSLFKRFLDKLEISQPGEEKMKQWRELAIKAMAGVRPED